MATDWLATYCVSAPNASAWAGTWAPTGSCAAWATGACTITAWTLAYDAFEGCSHIEFRLYRGSGPPYPTSTTTEESELLLATSSALEWAVVPPPFPAIRHVRISYGRQPQTQMHVSWTSDDPATPGRVLLGSAPGVYDYPSVPAAAPLTYSADDTCGPPSAWAPPGHFFHALLTGLRPSTRYYARPVQVRFAGVLSIPGHHPPSMPQGGASGPETTWVTGKARDPDAAVAFAVVADFDVTGGSGSVTTAARIAGRIAGGTGDTDELPLDFLLHVGDLGYGTGDVAIWETFMDVVAPVSASLPYHVSVGTLDAAGQLEGLRSR